MELRDGFAKDAKEKYATRSVVEPQPGPGSRGEVHYFVQYSD